MSKRILVLGAGAIGMYVGGSLAYLGEDVIFFDRPEVQPLLSSQGFQILTHDNSRKIIAQPKIVSDLDSIAKLAPYDFALIAVKSYDTESLLEKINPIKKLLPPIVCLQNGVENESYIHDRTGGIDVIPASVTTAIGKPDARSVVVQKLRGIGIGENHVLSEEICSLFTAADLNCRLFANPLAMKWSKLLTNLTANATSAILDMTPGEILRQPQLFRLEMRQICEALNVMRALQIPVVDLPGTPVKAFAFISKHFPAWLSQPILLRSISSGRGEKMPSFHIDLASGRGKSEVQYLNGAVVRFGANQKLECPVNRLLTETLLGVTRGEIKHEVFRKKPEALLGFLSK